MPLDFKTNIKPVGNLGVWRIEESEDYFLQHLALYDEEINQLKDIKGMKRLEWLAGRHLVHILSERQVRGPIVKDIHGKPSLKNSTWNISISHTEGLAAVIAAPYSVGVDIQKIVTKIGSIKNKFMHQEELDLLQGDDQDLFIMHVIWGVKESLFKAYGKGSLSWTENFRVEPFIYQNTGGQISGWIRFEDMMFTYTGNYCMHGNNMLTYVQGIHYSN
jgi:4'-phosphopantetheinyl transferase